MSEYDFAPAGAAAPAPLPSMDGAAPGLSATVDASAPPQTARQLAQRITDEMHKTIVGQEELVEMLVVAVLAGGHVLLEGVPGTAKTLSVRTLARIFDVSFARIQFTPDLMPSDILGVSVFDPRSQQFNLKKGPIFAGLLLADEVNRTPPKTQSALLEAMEERRVTIDGISHSLPEPFLVCATQNPIEYEGTYPLPEAQLDRFMLKVTVAYPSADEEQNILNRVQGGFRAQNLDTAGVNAALTGADVPRFREEIERVRVEPPVVKYIVEVIRATRDHRHLILGASPRAAITLLMTSKSLAAIRGRDFVTPDDVKTMARPVLRHRLAVRPESEIEGYTGDRIVESILQSVEVPR
ncbi:MAG TPA: MoxR family ATPase [Chthonomonadaceae bacterium]|nr:MoxR family ATPase [Chthonomonadaceae bacterium]